MAFLSTALRAPAFWLAFACLLLHLVGNPHYGAFRDELYFIVCGLHPALGYADQPPLVPLIDAASYRLFGLALTPLRLAPALAMTATAALTGELARRIGGGRFAQALAGVCVVFAPVLLADGVLATTDMLQPLSWLACAYLLTRLAQGGDRRLWLALGAVVGASLWSKYLIGFYAVGLAAGVLASGLRRELASPWPWVGAALALAVIAPNFAWQAANGFPFLDVAAAGAGGKNVVMSPLGFLGQQLLFLGPPGAPVWLAGLWRLAVSRETPAGRALAVAYVVTFALFFFGHGKAYYLAPAYPALFAAGGVFWEDALRPRALRAFVVAVFALAGLVFAPLALPVLPPPDLVLYSHALGIGSDASATERGASSALPQYFADMLGWPEMAAEVARVYRALPEDERRRAAFFGRNYGEASAVALYGAAEGGPPALSGHNQFYLWGPRGYDGSALIALGAPGSRVLQNFDSVELAGRVDAPFAMPSERGLNVYVLRRPKQPLAEMWPTFKHMD